jgi:hypothetical protein
MERDEPRNHVVLFVDDEGALVRFVNRFEHIS